MKKGFSILLIVISTQFLYAQSKINLDSFNEVVLNSGIDISLIQDGKEFITLSDNISKEDVIAEVHDGKLEIELNEANKKTTQINSGYIKIHYKTLNNISVLGNEKVRFPNLHQGSSLVIKLFDHSNLRLSKVSLENLKVFTYGNSFLLIEDGYYKNAEYRCYASSKLNTINVEGNNAKVISFGDNFIRMNASDLLHITSYGDTKIDYIGDLKIKKGIIKGRLKVKQILEEEL